MNNELTRERDAAEDEQSPLSDFIDTVFVVLIIATAAGVLWLGYNQYWQNQILKAIAENAILQSERQRQQSGPCSENSSDVRTFEAKR